MIKSKDAAGEELAKVNRNWPHVPEHVRRTIVELVSHYEPPTGKGKFPTPPGAEWRHVEIVLLSPEVAQISVGSITQRYTFAAMGLTDRRGGKRTRSEGQMLRTYALNPEPDAYHKLPYRENLKVHISRFRHWLQNFFGIAGDPLESFESGFWRPRFKIRALY
jgi:hypothetical protein